MLFSNGLVGLLNAPVGNNLRNQEDDVTNLKKMFSFEGRYQRPVENGFIDQELNDSIWSFQKEESLKRDGIVNPGGETEATLASRLIKPRPKPRNFVVATAPALIPASQAAVATLEILGAVGAGIWATMSKPEREDIVKEKEQEEEERKSECDRKNVDDTEKCNNTTKKKGRRAGAVCHSSASERYSKCLAGKPEREWPPLQE